MNKIVKASLVMAAVLSLSACSLFDKNDAGKVESTVIPHSGTVQKEAIDVNTNTLAWADYSAKLPRNFPEIEVNGSSNFNNFVSQQGIISVTWTNTTEDNMNEIISFLENELDVTFEENGDVMTAYAVELSGTKYDLNISYSEGDPEMVTMSIHISNV